MKAMGQDTRTIRAGHANMFLSPLFRETFATVTGARVELFDANGAQGAARGAGVGAGLYRGAKEAFRALKPVQFVEPDQSKREACSQAYSNWERALANSMR
jgi:xylulokinase